jgi:hypothetical protein
MRDYGCIVINFPAMNITTSFISDKGGNTFNTYNKQIRRKMISLPQTLNKNNRVCYIIIDKYIIVKCFNTFHDPLDPLFKKLVFTIAFLR